VHQAINIAREGWINLIPHIRLNEIMYTHRIPDAHWI